MGEAIGEGEAVGEGEGTGTGDGVRLWRRQSLRPGDVDGDGNGDGEGCGDEPEAEARSARKSSTNMEWGATKVNIRRASGDRKEGGIFAEGGTRRKD